MPTTTTNLSLNKPLVANPADADLWGGYLNTNMDTLDGVIYANAFTTTTSTYSQVKADFNTLNKLDASGGAITVNLAAAATLGNGWYATFVKTDSSANTVTLDPNSTETIDGASTLVLSNQYETVTIYCDGSNFFTSYKYGIDVLGSATAGNTITFNASGAAALVATGSAGNVLTSKGAGLAPTMAANPFGQSLLHVQDQKSSGTAGGTFTAGAWQTRTLNTVLTNEFSATVSSNQITLPSGTYYIEANAPAMLVDSHKAKLYNTTDAADVLIGTSCQSSNNISNFSVVYGRFTIAAEKTFELQHRGASTRASDGFGPAASLSVVEVYSDVRIWKLL